MINDLYLLEIFLEVAKESSFSAAAVRLGISQSVASKKLKQLEVELKTDLFVRNTRSVQLTESGYLLLERAPHLLREARSLSDLAIETTDSPEIKGTLRISLPQSYATARLASIIKSFSETHPGINFDLVLSNSFLPLNENNLDFAIRIGKLQDSNLMGLRIETNDFVVCAAPSLCRKIGSTPSLAKLRDFSPMYLPMHRNNMLSVGKRTLEDVIGQSAVSVDSGEVINQLAIEAYGVAVRPLWDVQRFIQEKKLSIVHTREKIKSRSAVYLVHNPRGFLPRKMRLFLDHIRDTIKSKME